MFISRSESFLFYYGTLTCFGAVAFPYHIPATFSIPCNHLPVQCLEQICDVPPNSTLLSTSRLSHRHSSFVTSSRYCLGDT